MELPQRHLGTASRTFWRHFEERIVRFYFEAVNVEKHHNLVFFRYLSMKMNNNMQAKVNSRFVLLVLP